MIGFSRMGAVRRIVGTGTLLQTVTRLDDVCEAEWRLTNGSVVTVPITQAQYVAMQAGTMPPNTTGDPVAVCIAGGSKAAYDTADGKLHAGQTAVFTTGPGWLNSADPGGSRVVIGTTTRHVSLLASEVTGSPSAPASMSVANTRRAKVYVIAGLLIEEA